MIESLIGKKVDQAQTFLENGKRIPVTEVLISDNVVLQVKTPEKDTYFAVQLGFGVKKKPTKALVGHTKKAGVEGVSSTIREVSWDGIGELPNAGDVISVGTVFKAGDMIKVTATSKGKGFAGGVKRHGFGGGPKTHGQSDRHRAPGSIGQGTTPGRVYKGKKMAGHMGVDTVTVSNLTVVDVDAENKKLYILGLIPGHKNAIVVVKRTGDAKNFVRLLSTKQKEDALAAVEAKKAEEEAAKAAEEVKKAEENVSETEETQPEKEESVVSEESKEEGK
jgi:large subunit ribosomal protein L3